MPASSVALNYPHQVLEEIRISSTILHGDETNEPPEEWNIQPPESHFKYKPSPIINIPVVSSITWRLNQHAIDNGDVEIHPSDFLSESNSELVPDTDTTPIK